MDSASNHHRPASVRRSTSDFDYRVQGNMNLFDDDSLQTYTSNNELSSHPQPYSVHSNHAGSNFGTLFAAATSSDSTQFGSEPFDPAKCQSENVMNWSREPIRHYTNNNDHLDSEPDRNPPAALKESSSSAAASESFTKKKKKPLKAPAGAVITEKSCLRCRLRKVKCDRLYPRCHNCTIRGEDCDLITLHPNDVKSSTERDRADSERLSRLEDRLAQLETSLGQASLQEDSADDSKSASDPKSLTMAVTSQADISSRSVDWRLATPQMAKSLSQHLCDAFFESCCFVLPSFSYYRDRLPAYRNATNVAPSTKVAIAAFCAVGARASPHSALLGIKASPDDARDHPEAPLLSAGTRRQSACHVLLAQAHSLCFEQGLMDEAKIENLAAVLALMQMTTFVELHPKKSRSLLRSALAHYKELQDAASTLDEARAIERDFGYAIYTADCLNSAYARRACLITDDDLVDYFSHSGIALPILPDDKLLPVLRTLLVSPVDSKTSLRTALHLISCWTAACQRLFCKLTPRISHTQAEIRQSLQILFEAIDRTRAGIHFMQNLTSYSISPRAHTHGQQPRDPHNSSDNNRESHGQQPHHHHDSSSRSSSSSHSHSHEDDYLARVIRYDRDLLDLFSLALRGLMALPAGSVPDDIRQECLSRVRKALKCEAVYVKYYSEGADAHMLFHVAVQLDLTPDWTRLALQKVGDPNGPRSADEELTRTELDWLTEAMQIACYYTPHAEKRLQELSPRFVSLETARLPDDPFPRCVQIGSPDEYELASVAASQDHGAVSHSTHDSRELAGFELDSFDSNPTFDGPASMAQHQHQQYQPTPTSSYHLATSIKGPASSHGGSTSSSHDGRSTSANSYIANANPMHLQHQYLQHQHQHQHQHQAQHHQVQFPDPPHQQRDTLHVFSQHLFPDQQLQQQQQQQQQQQHQQQQQYPRAQYTQQVHGQLHGLDWA